MNSENKKNKRREEKTIKRLEQKNYGTASIDKSSWGLVLSLLGIAFGAYFYFDARVETLENQILQRIDENHVLRIDHGEEVTDLKYEMSNLRSEIGLLKSEIKNLANLLRSCQNKS